MSPDRSPTSGSDQAANDGDLTKNEVLATSPLFHKLLLPELDFIASMFVERRYDAGDVVFREGDDGRSLFVIASGSVEVLRGAPNGAPVQVAVLKNPGFFGEMSLIDSERRSATIKAMEPTALLELTSENLHSFARIYRNGFTWVAVNIAKTLSQRLRETNRRLTERS